MLLLFIMNSSQAQFLKKLKQRIQVKAENVVVEKTSDKVAEKTSNSLDKVLDINPFGNGGNKEDPSTKGIKAINDAHEIAMYFKTEVPVSFNVIYKNKLSNIPEGLKKYFKENERSLMLEMKMNDKDKSKNNATMECIGLEEVQKQIDKSNYNT